MAKLVRVIKYAFVGFIFSYILAAALSNWIWLEMRLNVAASLPIGTVLGGLLLGLYWQLVLGPRTVLLAQGILLITMLISYGGDLGALLVLPAVLLREGFKLGSLSLQQLNILLIIIWLAGNGLWFFTPRQQEE